MIATVRVAEVGFSRSLLAFQGDHDLLHFREGEYSFGRPSSKSARMRGGSPAAAESVVPHELAVGVGLGLRVATERSVEKDGVGAEGRLPWRTTGTSPHRAPDFPERETACAGET